MSNGKHETIADILRDMHYCAEKNSAWCCTTVEFETFADRIEAAEREREAGAEAAQIIGEMVGREASKNQSVTNCNRLGNAAKMREALEKADAALSLISKSSWFVDANFAETIGVIEAGKAIQAALSERKEAQNEDEDKKE